jgi:cholesterol transport system auxiliary component
MLCRGGQLTLIGGLAACAVGGTPPRHFTLRPLASSPASAGPTATLSVGVPSALQSLQSERIAYQPDPQEVQYFAGADWVDRAPDLVRMTMIRSLQNRTRLQVSAGEIPGLLADYQLNSILQDFQAERDPGRPTTPFAHVGWVLSLTRNAPRRIWSGMVCEARLAAVDDRLESIVAAFEQATWQALTQMIDGTLAAISDDRATN